MIRISRLSSLAAGTVLLALPIFAACGGGDGDSDAVDIDTWTTGLCDSVTSWLEDVEELSDFEIASDSTPEEIKDVMVEFLTDVASPDFHPLAGKAKDVAAGAVLIAAIGSAIIGIIVFGPYVLAMLWPAG